MSDTPIQDKNVRSLGRTIEHAGDELRNRDEAEPSQRALGEIAAQVGHCIVAVHGGRRDYTDTDE